MRPTATGVECPGPREVRLLFYRSLARALSVHGRSGGALFESSVGRPIPQVTVRPASVADALRADPALASAMLRVRDVPAAPRPPAREGAGGLFVLVSRAANGDPAASGVVRYPPVADRLLGLNAWLGIQTFWATGPDGALWTARRGWHATATRSDWEATADGVGAAVAAGWNSAIGARSRATPLGARARADWCRGGSRTVPRAAWVRLPPHGLEEAAEPPWSLSEPFEPARSGHALVLGASGSGKTFLLARTAARAIGRGAPVFAIDLHGDLAPGILERLPAGSCRRIVCLDATRPPVPGLAALSRSEPADRAAAHLVAALKRVSADGGDLYWGFRLERIFDSFVRLVQESDGSLVDLYALLADPDRRDAARLATRNGDLARFLEELGPIARRNPEFLWSATARLSKVVLSPVLAGLLAPADGGLPVEELLSEGRSVLLRLPFARVGPEAATLAATLVLARVYLGLAARGEAAVGRPTLVVLDEVHGFSPRLVAEILTEGRKFGIRALLATQYPDRLAPELRLAAAGVVGDLVAFRVPSPSTALAGSWLGMRPDESDRWVTDLAPGYGLAREPARPGVRVVTPEPSVVAGTPDGWVTAVERSRAEFPPPEPDASPSGSDDPTTERVLLAALGADEQGGPFSTADLVERAVGLPGGLVDRALVSDRVLRLERHGLLDRTPDGLRLSPAGERRLGMGRPTGAARETAEHRALLLAAFRVFARHGHRLEIVVQGRWDTTLPDALFRQIPESLRRGPAPVLAARLRECERTWAWKFFRGRDVHVEAEVSGALRPARVRHGVRKAERRGAFSLFLVADAYRAARIRTTLRSIGAGVGTAQVWTLPSALGARVATGPREGSERATGRERG